MPDTREKVQKEIPTMILQILTILKYQACRIQPVRFNKSYDACMAKLTGFSRSATPSKKVLDRAKPFNTPLQTTLLSLSLVSMRTQSFLIQEHSEPYGKTINKIRIWRNFLLSPPQSI